MSWRFLIFTTCAVLLAGCSVNPVTGERDLMLVSSEQDLATGAQMYVPMQQSQGGIYGLFVHRDPGGFGKIRLDLTDCVF